MEKLVFAKDSAELPVKEGRLIALQTVLARLLEIFKGHLKNIYEVENLIENRLIW